MNPSGTWYNYSLQDSLDRPGQQNSLRVDYNITDKWRAFFRGTNESTSNKGANSTVNRYAWMADADVNYKLTGPNLGGTVTWVASPDADQRSGFRIRAVDGKPGLSRCLAGRSAAGQTGHQPAADLSRSESAQTDSLAELRQHQHRSERDHYGVGRPLPDGRRSRHLDLHRQPDQDLEPATSSKPDLQYEKVHYLFEQSGPNDVFAGKFDFSFNSANTVNNTTYPYANALLGYFNSYTESTNRTQYSPVTPILEFYVQDTWKVVPRLTSISACALQPACSSISRTISPPVSCLRCTIRRRRR